MVCICNFCVVCVCFDSDFFCVGNVSLKACRPGVTLDYLNKKAANMLSSELQGMANPFPSKKRCIFVSNAFFLKGMA